MTPKTLSKWTVAAIKQYAQLIQNKQNRWQIHAIQPSCHPAIIFLLALFD